MDLISKSTLSLLCFFGLAFAGIGQKAGAAELCPLKGKIELSAPLGRAFDSASATIASNKDGTVYFASGLDQSEMRYTLPRLEIYFYGQKPAMVWSLSAG